MSDTAQAWATRLYEYGMNRETADFLGARIEEQQSKMREALLAFRRRAHFIGHPEEPMTEGLLKSRVPDWRDVIRLVEDALGQEKTEG